MKRILLVAALAISTQTFASDCNPDPVIGRNIESGQSVIYQNKVFVVNNEICKEAYDLRSTDGMRTLISDVPRDQLSVMSRCNNGHCISDFVYDLETLSEVRIMGLSFDGGFIVRPVNNSNMYGPVKRQQLARTKDCVIANYSTICVGSYVKDESNQRFKVVGIQQNEKLVLSSTDGRNTISANVDPTNVLRTL